MWTGDGVEITFDRDLVADYDDEHSSAHDFQLGLSFGSRLNELRGYRSLPLDREGRNHPPRRGRRHKPRLRSGGFDPLGATRRDRRPTRANANFGFNLAVHDNG